MKIKKDDTVKITAGKDKGKTGKVEKVFPKQSRVIVSGANVYKKHVKPRGEGKPGGIIEFNRPLPMGNIALLCPKCEQQTRVGYQLDKQGKKQRICRKCQELIK